jgi:hypothetical protein
VRNIDGIYKVWMELSDDGTMEMDSTKLGRASARNANDVSASG